MNGDFFFQLWSYHYPLWYRPDMCVRLYIHTLPPRSHPSQQLNIPSLSSKQYRLDTTLPRTSANENAAYFGVMERSANQETGCKYCPDRSPTPRVSVPLELVESLMVMYPGLSSPNSWSRTGEQYRILEAFFI